MPFDYRLSLTKRDRGTLVFILVLWFYGFMVLWIYYLNTRLAPVRAVATVSIAAPLATIGANRIIFSDCRLTPFVGVRTNL